jgi:C1A family cysteine protease
MPSEETSELLRYRPASSQGHSKECTAYAAVAAMESWILQHRPEFEAHLPLSEHDLFRMIPVPKHSVRNALKVAREYGIVEQGASPERAGLRPRERQRQPQLYWHVGFSAVPDASTPTRKQILMMKALEQGHPLVTSIYVDRSFLRHQGTVYKLSDRPLAAAHAICIIGYNRAEGYWIAKNSMGPEWGTRGGCFAFGFGDRALGAEDLVWEVENVTPPAI